MRTRLQDNVRQPKVLTDGTMFYQTGWKVLACIIEPSDHAEAMEHAKWKNAMDLALGSTPTWCKYD